MITLLQLSDCHLLKDKEKVGYAGIAPYHSLARVLQNAVSPYIKRSTDDGNVSQPLRDNEHKVIMLVTGDISGDNSLESYRHFTALMEHYLAGADIEWYVLAGNHDNNPHFEAVLGERTLKSDKPIVCQRWHIHGLDTRSSSDIYTAAGELKNEDVCALEQALVSAPRNNHLVALHHHVLPSNSWMDKHYLDNASKVVALSEQYSQIKALIHGHVHSPLRQTIGTNRIPSYGSPSTCWQWKMQVEFGVSDEAPGYQVIELCDDGAVNVTVKRVEK